MKNTKAKFSNKTKEAIYERDGTCFNCGNQGTDCHHIFYGIESERTPYRNEIDKGVLTCRDCHNIIHSCKSGFGLRQEAIDYINNLNL